MFHNNKNVYFYSKMKEQSNIFTRFISIWRPDFFKDILLEEKSSGPTWKFWFFGNSILTVIITAFTSFSFFVLLEEVEKEILPNIENFEIEVKNGKLTTTFPDPFLWSNDDIGVVILDTKKAQYDETTLHNYSGGFFVSTEKFIWKDAGSGKTETRYFSEINENFSLSKVTVEKWLLDKKGLIKSIIIGFLFFGIWIFLNIIRLVTAVIWAFIFWIVSLIAEVEKFNFGTSYLAVLNLYFIHLIIEGLLIINMVIIPFSSFILFAILFGMNFWTLKQKD